VGIHKSAPVEGQIVLGAPLAERSHRQCEGRGAIPRRDRPFTASLLPPPRPNKL
jgi:hypothetical protein